MAEITAGLVKELREMTGLGMMECKRALEEAAGDIKKAEESWGWIDSKTKLSTWDKNYIK